MKVKQFTRANLSELGGNANFYPKIQSYLNISKTKSSCALLELLSLYTNFIGSEPKIAELRGVLHFEIVKLEKIYNYQMKILFQS